LLLCNWPDGHFHASNRVREKSNFAFPFKLIWVVQCLVQKFLYFLFSEIDDYSAYPGPKEGRVANVTHVGPGMRWTQTR